jgi:hypothetical protein
MAADELRPRAPARAAAERYDDHGNGEPLSHRRPFPAAFARGNDDMLDTSPTAGGQSGAEDDDAKAPQPYQAAATQ